MRLPLVYLSKSMINLESLETFNLESLSPLRFNHLTVGVVVYMKVCQSYMCLGDHCGGTIYNKLLKWLHFRSFKYLTREDLRSLFFLKKTYLLILEYVQQLCRCL